MRNFSDRSRRENQNTHFTLNNFLSENRAVYKVMQKNKVEPDMTQMTIKYMCFACWIPKATGTLRTCNTNCFSTAKMVI